ncbi:MAG: ATP-dependent helicase, partial [Candidatus Omnitrophica bacterium]|nr:ATP-dependent helicase [Candidatus Omnitrophota bacterium]
MEHLKNLNPEQLKVVNSLEGPVLVLAGPGTGKTQLLSVRTANIIFQKKALPENILILTFTNSASKTMKERLAAIIGKEGFNVEISTYHSFARNYIILDSEEAIKYIGERTQMGDVEKIRAIEYILDHVKGIEALRPFGAPYFYRHDIEKKISELRNEGVSPQEFKKHADAAVPDGILIEDKHIPRLKALAKVYTAYEDLKAGKYSGIFDGRGRFDYDDMIIIGTEMLKKEKALREKYRAQYKYIMVDEFQDSNGAQLDMLFCLVNPEQPNICCVGDDDQSIYRFQGANIGNFKLFEKKFPRAHIISLKSNYRSSEEILDLSSTVIKNIPQEERFEAKTLSPKMRYSDKTIEYYEFTTENEELLFIIKKIQELAKTIEKSKDLTDEEKQNPYNNIAILVRKRSYILKLIDTFLAAGIPYSTDGKEDIGREKRVRQLLDVLELACINTKGKGEGDIALFKVLTSDYLEIPVSDVLTFIARARKKKCDNLLAEFLSYPPEKLKAAAGVIGKLLNDARNKPVHSILMQYIHDAGVYRFLLRDYDKNRVLRIRDLRAITSFLNIVKNSDCSKPGISLDEFMEEIKIKQEHDVALEGELVTLSQNGVRIYTAHGAKGQEFHTVLIPFCIQDKSWPLRPQGDKLPLPRQVYKTREKISEKEKLKQLMRYDEI